MLSSDKEYEKQRIKCHEKLETQEWKKAMEKQVKKEAWEAKWRRKEEEEKKRKVLEEEKVYIIEWGF